MRGGGGQKGRGGGLTKDDTGKRWHRAKRSQARKSKERIKAAAGGRTTLCFIAGRTFQAFTTPKQPQVIKAKFSNPLTKLTDSPVVPLMSFLVDIDTFRLSQIIGKSDTKNRALTHYKKTQRTSVWRQFGIYIQKRTSLLIKAKITSNKLHIDETVSNHGNATDHITSRTLFPI